MHNIKCAASNLPNLTGMYIDNVRKLLKEKNFDYHRSTPGGYEKWIHKEDKSKVIIRPNGEVIREGGTKVKPTFTTS